ncbi:MAG: hypothetical protein MHPSP_001725, partial [Paramarteilia canceri]
IVMPNEESTKCGNGLPFCSTIHRSWDSDTELERLILRDESHDKNQISEDEVQASNFNQTVL